MRGQLRPTTVFNITALNIAPAMHRPQTCLGKFLGKVNDLEPQGPCPQKLIISLPVIDEKTPISVNFDIKGYTYRW